ncbi:hypothetical protein AHMF7616_05312 [Adhaeribacter pallidiroseus]|nr:hypothetical protein AHMF7616_05312 [Adhaeribacter pallidiroseus]
MPEVSKNYFVHLIIVNQQICEQANLDDEELTAVLLHELGHVFNMYKQEPIPTLIYCLKTNTTYNADLEAKTKEENSIYNEYYADYFVVKNGYSQQLIKSLKKYTNLDFAINHDQIAKRIQMIQNGDCEFTGILKELKPMVK